MKNFNTHITPGLFFTCEGQSGALTSLDPRNFFPSSPKERALFEAQYASQELYQIYIRIIVSTKGFNEQVENEVRKYNQSERGLTQPVFLIPLADYIPEHQVPKDLLGRTCEPTPSHHSSTNWSLDNFTIPARLTTPTPIATSANTTPQRQVESRFFLFRNKKQKFNPTDDQTM